MKTAVEYLVDEFKEKLTGDNLPDWVVKIIDKAKEMEKEHIIEAYWNGTIDLEKNEALKIAEQYYNETYKNMEE